MVSHLIRTSDMSSASFWGSMSKLPVVVPFSNLLDRDDKHMHVWLRSEAVRRYVHVPKVLRYEKVPTS